MQIYFTFDSKIYATGVTMRQTAACRYVAPVIIFCNTLIPFFFRAALIFAQQSRAKINGARKRPIFAQLGARKLTVRVLLKF